ncbi:amidohydrolase family protein [Cyclobacterium marinum]|uniref:Amidohydrolase n=1 Tax=Cyclobacterium marinum (strain ATCC 25205 / DSM 745 / LMG 13164 / NCIMB 1802) TaxID=880070 RepID=G0IV14_CYCMS|nr:amidohydrolase family protein [Cyclobacterium marinum]AEL26238.1 amidohydrolase [Cyclobacterium marinum DSM 745]
MNFLKRFFQLIGVAVLLLLSILIFTFLRDRHNLMYLNIENNALFHQNTYLIKNVNVIPMSSDTLLRNQMILIKEGEISDISQNIPESDWKVIDGDGAYILPGLIDMHVHVWDEYELGVYLANGVTAVRNLWGQPMHLRMKQAINEEKIIGPLFFTSSPKLTGPVYIGDDNLQMNSPQEAIDKVKEYKLKGYDFIKTYNGLTRDIYDAVIKESRKQGLEIAAHPSSEVPYFYHIENEVVTIEHAEDIVQQPLHYRLDTNKLNEVVALFKSGPNVSFCPTLVVFHNIYRMLMDDSILNSKQLTFMNPLIRKVDSKAQFDRWSQTKSTDATIVNRIKAQHNFHLLAINKLHKAGVNIVAGTDAGIGITPAGFSIHEELNLYKQAGMSNFEVLKTATVNASQTHDFLNNVGTLEVGKIANLIMVENNPLINLEELSKPKSVIIKGRYLSNEVLNSFKNKAMKRENLLMTGLKYLEYLIFE